MDPQMAQQMFHEGGTLVLLGMPPGTEFGIDLNSWNVGEKFKGVKMIPPGLHFIYYSAVSRQGDTAPRTGFFHVFQQRELLVRHYDPVMEDLTTTESSAEEIERIQGNLCNLDTFLGAYPLDTWTKWISLTQHITPEELHRLEPLSGKICSVPELITKNEDDEEMDHSTSNSIVDAKLTPSQSSSDLTIPASSINSSSSSSNTIAPPSSVDCSSNQSKSSSSVVTSAATDSVTSSSMSTTSNSNPTSDTTTSDLNTTISNSIFPTSDSSQSISKISSICNDISDPNSPNPIQAPKKVTYRPKVPNMIPRPGTELRFAKFPEKRYRDGATPSQMTQDCLDSTYSVKRMVEDLRSPDCLIAELQLSFITFLVGQVWEGWEHWRALIISISQAQRFLEQEPQLYDRFMSTLYFQINEVPEDLFVDIVEHNNFLASSMATLFANVSDSSQLLPPGLVRKAERFRVHLSTKFDWDLKLEDNEEDAPVVVEL